MNLQEIMKPKRQRRDTICDLGLFHEKTSLVTIVIIALLSHWSLCHPYHCATETTEDAFARNRHDGASISTRVRALYIYLCQKRALYFNQKYNRKYNINVINEIFSV